MSATTRLKEAADRSGNVSVFREDLLAACQPAAATNPVAAALVRGAGNAKDEELTVSVHSLRLALDYVPDGGRKVERLDVLDAARRNGFVEHFLATQAANLKQSHMILSKAELAEIQLAAPAPAAPPAGDKK